MFETAYQSTEYKKTLSNAFEEKVDCYGKFTQGTCSICNITGTTFKLRDCREEKDEINSKYTHYFCQNCVRLIAEKLYTESKDKENSIKYTCDSCLSVLNREPMIEFIHQCRSRTIEFNDGLSNPIT